ncbi:MAG: class B sortase [Eubacterium sp.]
MKKQKEKKKKGPGNVILNILIIVLIAVMAVSGIQLGRAWYRYHTGTRAYEQIQKTAGISESSGLGKSSKSTSPDWTALQKKYKNIKAWLKQDGTVINYPVAQADDNQYYLYRLINGKWNVKGTLFIDFRNQHPFHDFLTVIYGHRMKDHSMFWHIADYRKASYYSQHPDMMLYTPDGNYKLKIFAAATIPASSPRYQFDFKTKSDKQEYLNWIQKKTVLHTSVKVTASDRIVMLSTCTYEYHNARAVVFAKMVPVK